MQGSDLSNDDDGSRHFVALVPGWVQVYDLSSGDVVAAREKSSGAALCAVRSYRQAGRLD